MIHFKQSTASQEVMFGPFVDSTDGVSPEPSLTIANTDIRIQKAGASTFVNKNSGGATHAEDGYYTATFDATDTDTLGSGLIQITVAGAAPVRERFIVLPANVYDALIGGADLLQVDLQQLVGNATAADIFTKMFASDITGTAQAGAAGTITLASGASTSDDAYNNWWVTIVAGTGVGQRRLIHDYVGSTRVASISPNWAVNPDNTSVYVVTLGAPAPTDVSTLTPVSVNAWLGSAVATPTVAGVPEVDVTHVGGSAQNIATAATQTTINNNVVAAIADIATVDGKVDTANTHLTDIKGGTFSGATDSLEAIRNRGDAAWAGTGATAEQIADAVWDEATSGHLTTGSFGALLATLIITHLTDIKGAGFSGGTDSLEAIRDRGDTAWITGGGGAAPTVAQIRQEIDTNSTQLAAILSGLAGTLNANVTQFNGSTTVDGFNPLAAMRLLLAYAAGNTSGFDSNSPQFTAVDGSKVRIAGTLDGSKNRTVSTRDGS